MKHYSIGLLVAGIGLILGSCVPLLQDLWLAESTSFQRLALAPGDAAVLDIAENLTAVPVVRIEPHPGAADAEGSTLAYAFSIRNTSNGALLAESGTAAFGSAADGTGGRRPAMLRFRARSFPAGRWTVRLDVEGAAGLIRGAELRLLAPAPGLLSTLMTTLVLAILGWLTASVGALQWIRAEAARPGAAVPDTADEPARAWVVSCHLSAMLGYLLPFGHLLGPLAIWLAKRHTLPAVDRAGRDALNFQLSVTLYVLAALLLSFFLIGIVVLFVVAAAHFAVVLYAALRAQRGLDVGYPFSIRFI